jgi:membrane-bound serine protease (ClpP class)
MPALKDVLNKMRHRLLYSLLLLLVLPPALAAPHGLRLDVEGPIGPATRDYIHRALERAAGSGEELVLLRLDTPGGLDSSMRDIIKDILASPVPVVVYVHPNGARAASAGTYILYAAHVAAMTPATNLGAATPVQIAPTGIAPEPPGQEPEQGDKKQPRGSAMERKMVNDAVAYIRGLATLRGRNADWAEKAVREAASLPAEEALKENVIDLMAADVDELLTKLHGRPVQIMGEERKLDTTGMVLETVEPDWRNRLLATITDPNIAYILMLIGVYGLIFEFANPGSILPGVVGAICLLLALFAFQVLPVNYAGLALILLGIALMVAEAFVPSFGALGIGGVVAFVIGSVMLLDTDVPGFTIAWPLIGAFALTSALLFMVVLGMVFKARQRPVVSGAEELIGASGEALDEFGDGGTVRVHSELWRARSAVPVHRGQRVRVTGRDGLTLTVEPTDQGG